MHTAVRHVRAPQRSKEQNINIGSHLASERSEGSQRLHEAGASTTTIAREEQGHGTLGREELENTLHAGPAYRGGEP